MMADEYKSFKDWEEQKRLPGFKIFSNLQTHHIIIVAVMCVVGVFLYNKNPDNSKNILIIGLGVVIVWLIMMAKKEPERRIIPRHIAQRIAYEDLKYEKRSLGSFPEGTKIIPTNYCHLLYLDDGSGRKPIAWDIGFKIREPGKPEKELIVIVHPFRGIVTGIQEMSSGYTGSERRDIKLVFPEAVIKDDKSNQNK